MSGKIVLIDGHSILNRAFYGLPDLTNSEGMHTNGVYGFLNIMFKILDEEKPDYLTVAFDVSQPTFRHEIYPEYKGTRKKMPDELLEQVPVLQDVLKAMGISIVMQGGLEADDILGTIAKKAESENIEVTLVSGDRDLLQLASEVIKISIPKTKKGGSEVEEYHTQDVIDKYGVTPLQIIDLKGLMGDTSDNIPGVPGVGEKTAVKILTAFPSVEDAYSHIDEITPKRAQALLRENKELAYLSKKLATIKTDCDINYLFEDAKLNNIFTPDALEWIKRLELKSLIKRFDISVVSKVAIEPQDFNYISDIKAANEFVDKLAKAKPSVVGIAFTGDEWSNSGADKKKHKKSGGQLSFSFNEADSDTVLTEDNEEDEFLFMGFGISYEKDGKCLTACMLKNSQLTGSFIISLYKKIEANTGNISLIDFKNTMHLTTPVTVLEPGIAAPCQAAFNDTGISSKDKLFNQVTDISIAAYLLNPLKDTYFADDIARDYLGLTIKSYQERFGKSRLSDIASGQDTGNIQGDPLEQLLDYARELSYISCLSFLPLIEELKKQGMYQLFREIEMPASYYLYQMEHEGIQADRKVLEEMSALLDTKTKALETDIYDLAGEEFNINSPKQLGVILFEKLKLPYAKKTKTGYSTSADILEKLRTEDQVVPKILNYRQVSKLKSTYADGLPVYIESDQRIHGKFNQTITATGRISSTEPNLQNIPIRMELGRQLRKVFIPKEGCIFLDADYSQIELRILAHMSGDEELIEAYKNGDDIHRITASKVFHTPFEEVTDLQRRNAKAVNFGIVYGESGFGLAQDLNIDKKEADNIIKQYFETYPKIKVFLDNMVQSAKENGYSETIYGRRRPVPELSSSNYTQKSFGERVAMNSPIQGTAADIIKIAMIKVARRIEEENLKSRIVLQVHDELLVETYLEEKEKVRQILMEEMPKAAELKVPLVVEVEEGSDWFEAHGGIATENKKVPLIIKVEENSGKFDVHGGITMENKQVTMLNGSWNIKSADGKTGCPANIPGSVLSAAVENGILENPYYRMNEYVARDFLSQDFIFCKTFSLHKQEKYTYELCCDGIDTVADIYINGTLIKKVKNMHLRYKIECSGVLKDGENKIEIYFHSAIKYIESYIPQPDKEIHFTACGAMDRNQYIRKAHSMFGWDWGPQLPDMGIWRDIYIIGIETASIEYIKTSQNHGNGEVEVLARAFVKLAGGHEYKLEEAEKDMPGLLLNIILITPDGEEILFQNGKCTVTEPMLWWPSRYGKQPLYTVKAKLFYKDKLLDEKECRIGLRTLTVSQEKDKWGEEFAFCVNGVKIFAKGANYIPEDCIYPWITKERTTRLLKAAVDCGFNCIRVWGGGYYPSEDFYNFCDENGLVVWQDFMYACNIYELTEEFKENIIAETKDNVKRLCNHASLGLWCGNNEMESAWDHWGGFCDHPEPLRQDYLAMFEDIIPEALRSEDKVTFYWPSSPSSGGSFNNPDSDNSGDRHYWDVWHGEKPFSDYKNYYFRFCSEFGFQSFPCMETINTFTVQEDQNIFSEVMESHQKNGTANAKILHYISGNFLYPKDFKSLVYISQVLQGIAIKEGVEHWRRNRGRCMGSIYWQLNDNWPVASWSGIDYYGRWKALQYMARHFYADILGSLDINEDFYCTPYVQNETFKDSETEVILYVKDMDGNIIYKKTDSIKCSSLSAISMETISLKEILKGKENSVFIEALFKHSDGNISHQVSMPKPYKHMKIKKAEIKYSCTREEDQILITLKSNVPAFFTEIEVKGADIILSDNFIHLTDNSEYKITGKIPEGYKGIPEVCVYSLCDSYVF